MTYQPRPGPPPGPPTQPGFPGAGYGLPPYPPHLAPVPPGPRPPRVGLWVAVAAAAVLVVVVLVTGFVAPGFFLPGNSPTATPVSDPVPADSSTPAVPPTADVDPSTAAKPVAEQFLAKVNAGDTDGAATLACAGSESIVSGQLLVAVEPPTSLTLRAPLGVQQMGQQLYVAFEMTGSTKHREVNGSIRLQVLEDGAVCVRVLSFTGGQ